MPTGCDRRRAAARRRSVQRLKRRENIDSTAWVLRSSLKDGDAKDYAEPVSSGTSILNILPGIQAVAFNCSVSEASMYLWKAMNALLDAKRTCSTLIPVFGSFNL